jgi:hypothetical protein
MARGILVLGTHSGFHQGKPGFWKSPAFDPTRRLAAGLRAPIVAIDPHWREKNDAISDGVIAGVRGKSRCDVAKDLASYRDAARLASTAAGPIQPKGSYLFSIDDLTKRPDRSLPLRRDGGHGTPALTIRNDLPGQSAERGLSSRLGTFQEAGSPADRRNAAI